MPWRSRLVTARFEDVTGDPFGTVSSVADRWQLGASSTVPWTEETNERLQEHIDTMPHSKGTQGLPDYRRVSRPSPERSHLANRVRQYVHANPFLQKRLEEAEDLHARFATAGLPVGESVR